MGNVIPLVIGYTGLVSPAGLGIYWSGGPNVFVVIQQRVIPIPILYVYIDRCILSACNMVQMVQE